MYRVRSVHVSPVYSIMQSAQLQLRLSFATCFFGKRFLVAVVKMLSECLGRLRALQLEST